MSSPNGLDGGTPDGVPLSADAGLRYWRRKIAAAVFVFVATISAGTLQLPPLGLGIFQSEASAGAFAQPYTAATTAVAPVSGIEPAIPAPVATPSPTPSPSLVCPTPTYTKRRGIPSHWPILVQIPSIGVDAPVELAGVDRHGDMQVPVNPCDVAWFKLGPSPGSAGNAVIDGHLDWWTDGPAVFWKLARIRPGAEIDIIEASGAKVRFTVTTRVALRRTDEPSGLFTTTGPATLTLYTCAGVWEPWADTYSQRLFVDAVQLR
jgi:hypothetical protein